MSYYWLNKDSEDFLKRGYLLEGQKPIDRIKDIARNAENILGFPGFSEKFEKYMSLGFYSLSTPVWNNFGNTRGLPVSCYGTHISDSMKSILFGVSEVGMMSKLGGGTSAYFGELRPRGSEIKNNGESSGPVHFMEIYDSVTKVISQGSARRGSFAAYFPVEHPDIKEFLAIRSEGHPIQNINIGVTITDKWMNDMVNGDANNRSTWSKIIQKRFETGYPYIFFTDTVNNNKPDIFKHLNKKINCSNLCVSGDQRIPSEFGLLTAKELYEINKPLVLTDGKKKVNASRMELIEKNADVFEIMLDNGLTHKVTSYHKICILDKRIQPRNDKQIIITKDVECKDLKIGDSVSIQKNKGVFGWKNMPKEAFLLGMYQGDGTQYKDLITINIWEHDFDLENKIKEYHDYVCDKYNTQNSKYRKYSKPEFHECFTSFSKVRKRSLVGKALKKSLNFEKGYVPQWIWESDEQTQWEYIKGLFYTDGTACLTFNKKVPIMYLSLVSINFNFLKEIQIILFNLGISNSIRDLSPEGRRLLPDGKGGKKIYKCKSSYRLIISNKNDALKFEKNTGFLSRKKVFLEDREYRDNTKKFFKVKEINYVGKEDVYCCKVNTEDKHFVCNGIITHNCSEILLPSDDENSFVCVLSSLNLLHWDEIVKTDAIETLIYFLDSVNSEFVDKSENITFMQRAWNFSKNYRALGMGVLGWHSLLQSKMIPFESMKAKILNAEIFKKIKEKSDEATRFLSQKFGEPKLLLGTGERNATRIAIAPTTSSSFILGQVSQSIEPLNSNYFVNKIAKGNFTYKNPFLIELLKNKNKDSDEIWRSILIKGGSVQHLDFLSSHEKDVFKTFGEISQKEIVIQAAQRQKYIDQGQSLNLTIHHTASPKEASQLLIFGWQQGIKTFYYQRSTNPAQEYSRSLMECQSCSA